MLIFWQWNRVLVQMNPWEFLISSFCFVHLVFNIFTAFYHHVLSIHLSCMPVFLFFHNCFSSGCLSVFLSIFLSVRSVCLSVWMSICMSVCLSIFEYSGGGNSCWALVSHPPIPSPQKTENWIISNLNAKIGISEIIIISGQTCETIYSDNFNTWSQS